MRIALDRVCAHTRWPVGHVLLKDSAGQLASTSLWHLDDPQRYEAFRKVSETMTFAPGVGLPGRVLEQRKPAWIVDVTKDANFPRSRAAQDTGLRAGFAFPVLVGEEVVALMEFFSDEPAEPDDAVLAIMAHVGGQLGRVIERQRAEEALKLASQHKSQFLANMSHELRTPLNAIIGVTEMLQEDARDLQREDEFEPLDRVLRAARHLLALINDILDLSKIEAGRMDLLVESFAIAPVVQDVVQTDRDARGQERQRPEGGLSSRGRVHVRGPDPHSPGAAQPGQQRGQVHREGHDHRSASAARWPTPATGSSSPSQTPASA